MGVMMTSVTVERNGTGLQGGNENLGDSGNVWKKSSWNLTAPTCQKQNPVPKSVVMLTQYISPK